MAEVEKIQIATKVLNSLGAFYSVQHQQVCCVPPLQRRDGVECEHHHHDAAPAAQACWSGGRALNGRVSQENRPREDLQTYRTNGC